jgi:large subunit ribosomal protein L4
MNLTLLDANGVASSQVEALDTVFGREYNEPLIHQVVVAFQANARSADSSQKTRAEVHHSTKKPYNQKGTGRARAGMTSSPIWRGGGRTFPNKPDQNYSHKLNKKMYRAGLASILSQLVRENRLSVVEAFAMDSPKTKALAAKLKAMNLASSVLIITDNLDENTYLAARNLPHVMVVEARHADPVSLVHFEKVLITKSGLAKVQELFA